MKNIIFDFGNVINSNIRALNGLIDCTNIVFDTVGLESNGSSIITVYSSSGSLNKASTQRDTTSIINIYDSDFDIQTIQTQNELDTNVYFYNSVVRNSTKPIKGCGTVCDETDGFIIHSSGTFGTTANRPVGIHTENSTKVGTLMDNRDIGFRYFDVDLGYPIYASAIANDGTVTWVDATGATV